MIKMIIKTLRKVSNDTIYKVPNNDIGFYYKNLKKEDFDKKRNKGFQCGSCAYEFIKEMHKIGFTNVRYLFVYHDPCGLKDLKGFCNRDYLLAMKNGTHKEYVENSWSVKPRYSTVRHTHALAEVLIDKEWFVADPFNCLLYVRGKEDLCRGIGIEDSFMFENQIDWLMKEWIHIHLHTMFYCSEMFWKNVYRITYETQGDLP